MAENLMSNNLFTNDQHEFVLGVESASLSYSFVWKFWRKCMTTGFVSMFDAFDSVHTTDFPQDLHIQGDILKWIKSFLRGRTQCVNVDGAHSTWRKVISGILQGSVNGSIFFVIFMNDMPYAVTISSSLERSQILVKIVFKLICPTQQNF